METRGDHVEGVLACHVCARPCTYTNPASRLCSGSWDTYPETLFLSLLNVVCPGRFGSGAEQLPNLRGSQRRAFPSHAQHAWVAVTAPL